MLRFLATRIGLLIPTFLGITVLTFALVRLIPGDPVLLMAGERGMPPERYALMQAAMGLDRPLWEQYGLYVWNVARGDLGLSIITKRPVLSDFLTLFPATVELSACAILFAIALGLPIGILAAVRRGRPADHTVMGLSLAGYSMPIFWWGILLIMLFSIRLNWTPVSGRLDILYFIRPVTGFMLVDTLLSGEPGAFRSALSHLVLPTIVLGTIPLAVIARMTRSAMLEVLHEDYVRTARAKGLKPGRVVWVHALRNALIPVVTVIGLQVSVLLTGAILTETIFAWPGIGSWIIGAIGRRDYPVLQGGVLLIATVVILVNLTVELLYGVINPRISRAR